jgi:hypothetical protein
MWHQLSAEDAVTRGYASVGSHEHTHFETYLETLRKETAKQAILTKVLPCGGDQRLQGLCFVTSM